MHVLFVHKTFPAQFGRLGLELVRRHGWTCSFLAQEHGTCPSPSDEMRARLPVYPIALPKEQQVTPWMQIFGRSMELSVAVFETLRALPDLNPDLIVGHQNLGPTLLVPELRNCPRICYCEFWHATQRGDLTYRLDLPPAQPAPFYPRCMNAGTVVEVASCDAAYSATRWQKDSFPERFHPKIEVHFDGLDTELYRPRAVAPAEFSPLLNGRSIPEGMRVVTYVARGLESMRGFDLFLRIAREIARVRSDVLFVIAGGEQSYYGWDRLHTGEWSFKDWALRQGAVDPARFVFLGQIDPEPLAHLLARSDLHLYLSVPFVLSWSLFNALACSCVVLASDMPQVREVIEDGTNGLLAPFHDIEAFTRTALRVLDDPEEYRPLGEAGRALIQERYSLDVAVPALTDFFERVASAS